MKANLLASVEPENTIAKQWRLLLIYNVYRVFCIIFFLLFFLFSHSNFKIHSFFYLLTLFIYLTIGLFLFYTCKIRSPKFTSQILIAGTLDIIFTVFLITCLGDMRSGFVILINVIVAALSILVPGRLAIFFASIASCLLLSISFIEYFYGKYPAINTFDSSGIYGASIFATALTACYLANRVKISENIAYRRGNDLAGMQRINEYIVERLHSGVIYVDLNRHIQLMNTAAKNFFNLNVEQSCNSLSQLSEALDKKCQQFLNKIEEDLRPAQVVLEDPFVRVHFFFVAIECQTAILIFLDDMTSIAQHAQQLKLASLGRLSASIAHELRNPLGAISHAVQLFGDTGELNSEDARLKELITNNCVRMNRVIKNVLQLSRREQSHPHVINFFPFIKQFKHNFCVYNECEIILNLPLEEQVFFIFDKSQLEQLLIILCDNSMQHGRDVNDLVKIFIEIKKNFPKTEIIVRDAGSGIPDHLQHNIFEPFFSTVSTGFGMGLFIAKDLCEINQAQLTVVPSTTGSCFVITIHHVSEVYL